jgi:hypothetical protein
VRARYRAERVGFCTIGEEHRLRPYTSKAPFCYGSVSCSARHTTQVMMLIVEVSISLSYKETGIFGRARGYTEPSSYAHRTTTLSSSYRSKPLLRLSRICTSQMPTMLQLLLQLLLDILRRCLDRRQLCRRLWRSVRLVLLRRVLLVDDWQNARIRQLHRVRRVHEACLVHAG